VNSRIIPIRHRCVYAFKLDKPTAPRSLSLGRKLPAFNLVDDSLEHKLRCWRANLSCYLLVFISLSLDFSLHIPSSNSLAPDIWNYLIHVICVHLDTLGYFHLWSKHLRSSSRTSISKLIRTSYGTALIFSSLIYYPRENRRISRWNNRYCSGLLLFLIQIHGGSSVISFCLYRHLWSDGSYWRITS